MAEVEEDGRGAARSTVVGLLRVAEALRPTAFLNVCLALVLLPLLMPPVRLPADAAMLVDALADSGVAGAGGPFIESEIVGPVAVAEVNGTWASKRDEMCSTGFLPLLLPLLPSPLPGVPLSLPLLAEEGAGTGVIEGPGTAGRGDRGINFSSTTAATEGDRA